MPSNRLSSLFIWLLDQLEKFITVFLRSQLKPKRQVSPTTETASKNPQPPHIEIGVLTAVTNFQSQSPLFSIIPAEIRNRIFRFACTAYEDPQRPYTFDDWCSRPGQKFCLTIDCALLRTCRRVYSEARLVPVAMNAHTFWYGIERAPRNTKFASDAVGYFARLSDEEREHVNEVHIFAQQCTIENWRLSPRLQPAQALHCLLLVGGTLRRLQITLRHTGMYKYCSPVSFHCV